jgi:acetyl-CoA/propionyl-CoA carboxylase biotin carboxyl carrier protein
VPYAAAFVGPGRTDFVVADQFGVADIVFGGVLLVGRRAPAAQARSGRPSGCVRKAPFVNAGPAIGALRSLRVLNAPLAINELGRWGVVAQHPSALRSIGCGTTPIRPPLDRVPRRMFSKVLIANRGEIAVRIIRACEELGIATVAVYSEIDRGALHVQRADEAYLLGPAPASESYLNIDRILQVCRESGAEAVHPGYGFLAENAAFARALEDAGITWIGPPSSAIDAMGSKTKARELMQAAGVPIVPGTTDPVESVEEAQRIIAETVGYPVAVKAAGGGGGKGFRVALDESELSDAFEGAAREGQNFFGDPTVYLERYLPDPRHVEVQVLADGHGNVIHLGERDCSLQRRHQKLIEESPAPAVDETLRAKIGKIATDAAAAVHYAGAGTIEGLLQDGEYFFLEMNTRVQVEHCVTEMVTGIDIVKEGIRVAAGAELSISQDDVVLRGHAIECRINAEDASRNFAPAPGPIGAYREPTGPGVRVDSGVGPGSEISPMYDPMVAKLIVWDADREQATRRMLRALGEYEIETLTTLIPFHTAILQTDQWANAETCRDLIEDREWQKTLVAPSAAPSAAPSDTDDADEPETVAQAYTVEVSGKRFEVTVIGPPPVAGVAVAGAAPSNGAAARRPPRRNGSGSGSRSGGGGGDTLASPLQGTILRVAVDQGAAVEEGALIAVVEAMKMENEITAHKAGTVSELPISVGASVKTGDTLAVITAAAE